MYTEFSFSNFIVMSNKTEIKHILKCHIEWRYYALCNKPFVVTAFQNQDWLLQLFNLSGGTNEENGQKSSTNRK